MPYIPQKNREQYIKEIMFLAEEIFSKIPEDKREGELNYFITSLLKYTYKNPNYCTYNRIIGLLECIKLEFYRRAVSMYEDKKIKENGDVY